MDFTALDPTKPNIVPVQGGQPAEKLVEGRTSGTWYRWVDTPYVEQALAEGLLPRLNWRDGQKWFSLWQQVYGLDTWPLFVSRYPLGWDDITCGGSGATLLAIDCDRLRLVPDYNMIDEDWHHDMAKNGVVLFRDWSVYDEPVIATYTTADLASPALTENLLFDGHAACLIDTVAPERLTVITDPASLPRPHNYTDSVRRAA